MQEKTLVQKIIENICIFLIAASSTAAMAGCLYLYKIPEQEWVGKCVLISLGSFLLFFTLKQDVLFDRYVKREEFKIGYFFLFHLIALLIAVFAPKLPDTVWPYLALYTMLSLFGNTVIGILDATLCLMISVIVQGGSQVSVFLMYFLSGCAAAIVFRNLDDDYKFVYPVTIAEIFHLLCLVFYSGYTISFDPSIILFASVNVVLSFMLILIVLKLYSTIVMHRGREKLMDLTNPENPILAAVKKEHPSEYFKAVHVAHFCDRIGTGFEMDATTAKTAGYYHNVGVLKGEINWENTLAVCEENKFPAAVKEVLKEFLDKDTVIKGTETVILLFSENVISAILQAIREDKDKKIDYDAVITDIFKQKTESGMLNQANITYEQMEQMKKIFIEEKLYYDFLR